MLVIQHIKVVWTKAARGGDEARRRNAVSERLPIPLCTTSEFGMLHQVVCNEAEGFVTQDTCLALEKKRSYDLPCIQVLPTDQGGALLRYRWSIWYGGAPRREPLQKTLTITPETWGQVIWNGRFVHHDTGQWRYEKHVVNVVCGNVTRQAFRENEPACCFDARGLLF